ncbi:methionyl-tRNA formyltransferase [Orrella marina]|uniref:Methionyl-tRNA formyltransferase n=1 Tax=Orrella marina TaxID=2163011 RepID=A0A2R4XMF6_9BURK|nr:methionyl-tRNA formyltransferase [Orrella marina]AWB34975.1 methionyl-tRNA formyltransferase [Orrella marina]
MKVGFAGTPEFASTALESLIEAGHSVVVVLSQPDRPSGRGMKLTQSPVKQAAVAHNIPVLQPAGLKLDGRYAEQALQVRHQLEKLDLDVLIVAAYGLILPAWLLDLPKSGCLNIHASLLPRWRGAAPIQRAIEAGDDLTGVTIMQMDEGLDTGDMLIKAEVAIDPGDNGQTLHDKLAACGASLIVRALELLEKKALVRTPQPVDGVTYAEKLLKQESELDLSRPATELARRIRAFTPFPGAKLTLPGLADPVKVFCATALANDSASRQAQGTRRKPGELLGVSADGIDLQTGEGILRVTELQRAGGKRQPVAVFLSGWHPPQS